MSSECVQKLSRLTIEQMAMMVMHCALIVLRVQVEWEVYLPAKNSF